MNSNLDIKKLQEFTIQSESIQADTPANWGKMNAAQMFQHLNKSLEVIFTNKPIKRMFIEKLSEKRF